MDYIDSINIIEDYEENDALSAGVKPGGLRNRNEIKILVCYMLKTLEQPITRQQLTDVIQGQGLANYFELSQAVSDLLSQGSLTIKMINEYEYLVITEMGKQVGFELETDIPKSVKEKAINNAIKILTIAKNERENKIDIQEVENGYNVTFTMEDGKDVIMKLTIYVGDIEQAELVKKNFLQDPTKVYSNILTSLMVE